MIIPPPGVTRGEFLENGSSGRELDYAESSATQTGIAGTAVDVTGLSIDFTVTDRPVYVEVDLPYVVIASNAATPIVQITDGAGAIKTQAVQGSIAAGGVASMRVQERISTPGSYTRKAQLIRLAGTGTIGNNLTANTISRIRAVEH